MLCGSGMDGTTLSRILLRVGKTMDRFDSGCKFAPREAVGIWPQRRGPHVGITGPESLPGLPRNFRSGAEPRFPIEVARREIEHPYFQYPSFARILSLG